MSDPVVSDEGAAIRERYARRRAENLDRRYDPLELDVLSIIHERERALRKWVLAARLGHPRDLTVMEVGCGAGGWLESFLRIGFDPSHLAGIDLLADDLDVARHRLPQSVRLEVMDAAELESQSLFDVCTQATALSSILDPTARKQVADAMWRITRPGGGVLSFDFAVANPANPDVIGIPVGELRRLFPGAERPRVWRLVLAPPLGRRAARFGQSAYSALRSLPPLRTHRLVWLPKPAVQDG